MPGLHRNTPDLRTCMHRVLMRFIYRRLGCWKLEVNMSNGRERRAARTCRLCVSEVAVKDEPPVFLECPASDSLRAKYGSDLSFHQIRSMRTIMTESPQLPLAPRELGDERGTLRSGAPNSNRRGKAITTSPPAPQHIRTTVHGPPIVTDSPALVRNLYLVIGRVCARGLAVLIQSGPSPIWPANKTNGTPVGRASKTSM
jgi:hypothetical protein